MTLLPLSTECVLPFALSFLARFTPFSLLCITEYFVLLPSMLIASHDPPLCLNTTLFFYILTFYISIFCLSPLQRSPSCLFNAFPIIACQPFLLLSSLVCSCAVALLALYLPSQYHARLPPPAGFHSSCLISSYPTVLPAADMLAQTL